MTAHDLSTKAGVEYAHPIHDEDLKTIQREI